MDKICEHEEVKDFPKVDSPEYTKKGNSSYSDYNDELEKAPNMVGKTISEARTKLYGYDLSVYYQYSETVAEGYIISQSVQDGRIVLNVSKGKNKS